MVQCKAKNMLSVTDLYSVARFFTLLHNVHLLFCVPVQFNKPGPKDFSIFV